MKKAAPEVRTVQQKKIMLDALVKNLGIITKSCEATGVKRNTFYLWLKTDDNFAKEVAELGDIALDFVEDKLMANIRKGDVASIIFYLKTKGKKRGYNEREVAQETTQNIIWNEVKTYDAP